MFKDDQLEKLLGKFETSNDLMRKLLEEMEKHTVLLRGINVKLFPVDDYFSSRSYYDDEGEKKYIADEQVSFIMKSLKRIEHLLEK